MAHRRYSPRHLLFGCCAGSRCCSADDAPYRRRRPGLFAVFYGLDWIAVPQPMKLTGVVFGRENTGVVYGWIGASHQIGASLAAFGAGVIRTELGDYRLAFLMAGVLCLIAGASFLSAGRAALSARLATAGAS